MMMMKQKSKHTKRRKPNVYQTSLSNLSKVATVSSASFCAFLRM